jgi:hypothetical protein
MPPSNKPLGRRDLRRFLTSLSSEQLIDEIVNLVDVFPQVREYYQAKISPEKDPKVRNKYKTIIAREFSYSGQARLSVARKAVTDYMRVASSVEGIADMMLYYVEAGAGFTIDFGDIDEPFYLSMERMYKAALEHLHEHGLLRQFEPRCVAIVEKTSGVGWGFHDTLGDIYERYYPEE